MMTPQKLDARGFTDADLERWEKIGIVTGALADLIARLRAAENAIGQHQWECDKNPMNKCFCGLDYRIGAWLASKGEGELNG